MPECCLPCPDQQVAETKTIDSQEKQCPPCCKKQCIVKPCYKQPKIPESYAPRRCYMKPTAPLESHTTYKMSYLPVAGKPDAPIKQQGNIVASCEPMEGTTVQRMSFLPNPICVTHPIRPCNHDMWGKGPLQSITTQRHDYVPKPCLVREPYKPQHKVYCVEEPFENKTINNLSYLPPEKIEKPKSYAPERCYEKPMARMEGCTTHKMSYLPNQIMPKEPLPWACKGQYQKPCQALEANTTYTMSYLDAKSDCRRMPIVPCAGANPVTPSKRFECGTVYKNSYLPAKVSVPRPIKPVENLVRSCAQMEGETVHRLSYLPNPLCVTHPIRPCNHDMWGKGPVQSITTQRHDYVPKPFCLRTPYRPEHKVYCVEEPFENKTINRMSYLNPGKQTLPESYAPVKCYQKPTARMECETTQKMSYQPVCTSFPQKPPWACKGQYQKPCSKLEGTTIYKASFLPPGEDCTEVSDPCCYGDCNQCPAKCVEECCAGCDFPRAACCS